MQSALPEAQVDRFKLKVTYPSTQEEYQILERMARSRPNLHIDAIIAPQDIMRLRELADEIFTDDKIKEYIANLVSATRRPGDFNLDIGSLIRCGASPRATIFLTMAAKAHALIDDRGYVRPQHHYCPNVDQAATTGCGLGVILPGSPMPETPVEWGSSRTGTRSASVELCRTAARSEGALLLAL